MLSEISDASLPWVLGGTTLVGTAVGAALAVLVDRIRPGRGAPARAANRSVWLDQIFGYDDRVVEPAEYVEGGAEPPTVGEGGASRA